MPDLPLSTDMGKPADRLKAWLDGIPIYENESELKNDVRAVLREPATEENGAHA